MVPQSDKELGNPVVPLDTATEKGSWGEMPEHGPEAKETSSRASLGGPGDPEPLCLCSSAPLGWLGLPIKAFLCWEQAMTHELEWLTSCSKNLSCKDFFLNM